LSIVNALSGGVVLALATGASDNRTIRNEATARFMNSSSEELAARMIGLPARAKGFQAEEKKAAQRDCKASHPCLPSQKILRESRAQSGEARAAP
jgi:hypothetical protein